MVGDGPLDIVQGDGFITNRHVSWEDPAYRRFCERLGSFARLILFDKRGMGLSDRVEAGTLEERMDDVRAVMDALGSEQAALIGISEGGPLSMLFAGAHPERTTALLLCGAEVKEEQTDDRPWGSGTREEHEEFLESFAEHWGDASGFVPALLPSSAGDPGLVELWGRLMLQAASPAAAETFMRMGFDIDVRHVAPAERVPTLIMHTVDDRICHVENARFLARTVPGARYVELSGGDHRWRDLLERQHDAVRHELTRFSGREIDTAGDGFLAAFDGPARAIRCAKAVVPAVDALGLQVRAGVHTGECEVVGEKLAGLAVHVGARVAAQAGPGEVLVSNTVRDLIAGSGIELEDRGLHALKGIDEERRLYAAV